MKRNLLFPLIRKKDYVSIVTILFCISLVANAQDYVASIPSPNAASLTNQIDVPVSQFSGKLNYTIPVYKLQEDKLDLPINLSYTPSGFKPNEHPSWVGSGFSLSAGGVITRKVRGTSDDLFYVKKFGGTDLVSLGLFYTHFQNNNQFDDVLYSNFPELQSYKSYEQVSPTNVVVITTYDTPSFAVVDFEPDDYYFSFGSISGKFIFDKHMNPKIISNNQNLKVEVIGLFKETDYSTNFTITAYSFSGFRIITAEGIVYEFGCEGGTKLKNVERSQNAMSAETLLTNDAWYLSKILSPSGEELANFEYLQNEWDQYTRERLANGSQVVSDLNKTKPIRQLILSRDLVYSNQPEPVITLPLNGKVIHPCYISNISTKNSNISFHTSISEELEHHPKDINLYLDNLYGEYFGFTASSSQQRPNSDHRRIMQRLTKQSKVDSHPTINWMQLDSITVEDRTTAKKVIKTSRFYYTHNKYERLRLLKYQENDVPPYLFDYLNLSNRYIEGETELDEYSTFGNWWYGTTAFDNLGYFKRGNTHNAMAEGLYLRGTLKKHMYSENNSLFGEFIPGYYYNYVPYSAKVYLDLGIDNYFMEIASQNLGRDLTEYDLLERYNETYENFTGLVEQELLSSKDGIYYNEDTFNCSINKIYTPMGGRIEFEYEPHFTTKAIVRDYSSGEVSIEDRAGHISGIRVASIKTYDAVNPTKYEKREFDYDMGILFYRSRNFVKYRLELGYSDKLYVGPFMGEGLKGGSNEDAQEVVLLNDIVSYSLNSFVPGATNDTGSYIGYSKVTETITNQNGESNGKVINYYSNYKDHPDLYTQTELDEKKDEHLDEFSGNITLPSTSHRNFVPLFVFPVNSFDMKRGKPLQTVIFDKDNTKIEETNFKYTHLFVQNPELYTHTKTLAMYFSFGYIFNYTTNIYLTNNYVYNFDPIVLEKQITTKYFDTGSITNETIYDYFHIEPYNQIELASQSSTSSNGDQLTTYYTYPADHGRQDHLASGLNIYEKMWVKNIVSPVITQVTKKDDKIIGGNLNTYRSGESAKGESPDQLLHDKSYQLLPKNTLPEVLYDANGTLDETIWDEAVEFANYDTYSNLIEYRKKDGTSTSIIWGYSQTKPIAKIGNATYAQVLSAISSITNTNFNTLEKIQTLSNKDDDRTQGDTGKEGDLREALAALREELPNAQVSTYTYDPLIGVTSMTDPKGYTMYYEYDEFNRLKQVKDADGNILSHNKYHYKGQ